MQGDLFAGLVIKRAEEAPQVPLQRRRNKYSRLYGTIRTLEAGGFVFVPIDDEKAAKLLRGNIGARNKPMQLGCIARVMEYEGKKESVYGRTVRATITAMVSATWSA